MYLDIEVPEPPPSVAGLVAASHQLVDHIPCHTQRLTIMQKLRQSYRAGPYHR